MPSSNTETNNMEKQYNIYPPPNTTSPLVRTLSESKLEEILNKNSYERL